MPNTPTVVLTALDNAIEVAVTNTDTPTLNEIWRDSEAEGLVCLSRDLEVDGIFIDYGVASGADYSYFARAITAGVGADSVTHTLAVILAECWAHAVDKTAGDSQRYADLELVLTNLPGQVRGPSRTATAYRTGGRDKPVVSASDIRDESLQVTLMFADDEGLDVLQELFDAKRYWCVRDQHGLKMFGTVQALPFTYQSTYTQVQFGLIETSFSEHVR